ncbi:response regulator [Fulvivirga ligni]|uniref:response regulator n=1 Tax=Fulvivirga ligni TaxID=2904246 RepID=UPI001F46FF9C|nr:response regulator [Fulvivirga ligni]UII24189.1 response regulator [Fulvivirga ligni]
MREQEYNEIILIEDNPTDMELTIDSLLEINKVQGPIHVLEDGQQALDYFFNQPENNRPNPKFIVLDLKLPKVNGLEVLRELKKSEKYKDVPVIILTSSNENSDIVDAYRFGANSYVVKPVNFMQFTETISKMALYWLLLNKPVKN